MIKLCPFCKNFNWDGPLFDGGTASCAEGKFSYENVEDDDEMRSLFTRAQSCESFELRDDCKQYEQK